MTEREAFLAAQRSRFGEMFEKENEAIRARKNDTAHCAEVIANADRFMQGMYSLPGSGGWRFFGNPPHWRDLVVSDEESLWSLARMPETSWLTEAYLLTGERKYAEKAIACIESFIDTCPPFGLDRLEDGRSVSNRFSAGTTNPWRQLEVGIRIFGSWSILYHRLLTSDVMTPEFHEKFAISVWQHLEQLELISPRLWPNAAHNHYLHEMLGLLAGALLFPDMKKSEQRIEFSLRELERCAKAQIMPDGAQLEGSPKYHLICVGMFLDCLRLAAQAGRDLPSEMKDLIDRSLTYSAWIYSPACIFSAIGDSSPRDYLIAGIAEKLYASIGSFGDLTPIIPTVKNLRLPKEVLDAAAKEAANTPGGIKHFPSVGQVFARTGWTDSDSWFSFICHTPVFNGHSHIDPMSIELVLEGREILVDPGAHTYEYNETRRTIVSAPYHSCLTVGGKQPYECIGPWRYTDQKPGSTKAVYSGEGFLAADAEHENYDPAIHRRLVILIGKKTMLVVDDLKNPNKAPVDIFFHLEGTDFVTDGGVHRGDIRVISSLSDQELLEGIREDRNGKVVKSTRFVAKDTSPSGDGIYLTAITTDPAFRLPAASRSADGICLTCARGDRFLWKFGEAFSKI